MFTIERIALNKMFSRTYIESIWIKEDKEKVQLLSKFKAN